MAAAPKPGIFICDQCAETAREIFSEDGVSVQALDDFHITFLEVVGTESGSCFSFGTVTFPEISCVVFDSPVMFGKVTLQVFRGDLRYPEPDRLFFEEYGTHGASTAFFQQKSDWNEAKFVDHHLKAEFFQEGDRLVISGHRTALTQERVETFQNP
jgi:hypothetical protein